MTALLSLKLRSKRTDAMLSISKEQFKEIYGGTRLIGYIDLFYTDPGSDEELYRDYLTSKLWRLNNLYTIVNKHGKRVRFKMNLAQHKVYAASLSHPRLVILKSRQQGISTLWLVSFFDDAVTNSDFSIGLMAQGQDEASTLLERTKILWDTLSPVVKRYFKLSISKDNTKEFSLSNGSNIFIRTSFRSTTLQRLHISEMGKIANKSPDKAQETKTGTLQAIAPGNTAVIESTAEGANMFKDMWDDAIKYSDQQSRKSFFPVFLSWLDDPDCVDDSLQHIRKPHADYFADIEKQTGRKLTDQQKNFWVAQWRELGDKIYQEYPSTPLEAFMVTKDGTYYAKLYLEHVKLGKREKADLYDKNLDVQVVVDLGMNDTNVLGVWQYYNKEFRLIDEVYDSGQKISYYTDILKTKPYYRNITRLVLPPDATVRELTSGKTREEVFTEELTGDEAVDRLDSLDVEVLPKESVNEGIEAVRGLILNLWVNPFCEYLIECFYNYTKEWDDRHGKGRWRDKPLHDEYSNGMDMVRYAARGIDVYGKIRGEMKRRTTRNRGMDV